MEESIESTEPDDNRSAKADDAGEGTLYASDQVIVIYKDQVSTETAQDVVASAADAQVTETLSENLEGKTAVVAKTSDSKTVAETVAELKADPAVDTVEPDYLLSIDEGDLSSIDDEDYEQMMMPNDSTLSDSWQITSIGADTAWSRVTCNKKVSVAVFDTGVMTNHEDLVGNVVASQDATQKDSAKVTHPTSTDSLGHGTHVAGIISAQSDNGIGVSGVSYNAGLVCVNVFRDDSGSAYTSDIIRGYQWLMNGAAEQYNVRVINMSLGGPGTLEAGTALAKQIDAANDSGIVTVVSAGNGASSGSYDAYPADYETCVSVINLGNETERYKSSNYGSAKDISAPGTMIYSTTYDGGYGYKTGTSMAAPVVSSVFALIFAADPSLSADEAKDIVYSTAIDLGAAGKDDQFGWGRINASGAIEKILGPAPVQTPDTTDNNQSDSSPAESDNSSQSLCMQFGDVQREAAANGGVQNLWYASWLDYAVTNKLMTGYSSGDFGPFDNITRAQVATILYRYASTNDSGLEAQYGSTSDASAYATQTVFPDEASGTYYTAAINWANATGVMTGSNGYCMPDNPITREQLCLMLQRYAASCGVTQMGVTDYHSITGLNQVSDWATTGVDWCASWGIIGGVNQADGSCAMEPQGNTWRAAMAKMITVTTRDVL